MHSMHSMTIDGATTATDRTIHAVPLVHDAILVTEGVLDEAAVRAFTQGQCHAFAYALHQDTGWDIVAMYEVGDGYGDAATPISDDHEAPSNVLYGDVSHFACRRPDGLLVDIEGVHTVAEFYASWASQAPYPHPEWGVMPPREELPDDVDEDDKLTYEEDYADEVQMALEEYRSRLARVTGDPAGVLSCYQRRAVPELGATIVPALLATLER